MINLVRDDYAPLEVSQSQEVRPGSARKHRGAYRASPDPLAGFRDKGGTPENGLRREGKRTGGE